MFLTPSNIFGTAPAGRDWGKGLLAPGIALFFVLLPQIVATAIVAATGGIGQAGRLIGPGPMTFLLVAPYAVTGWMVWCQVTRVEERPLAAIGLGRANAAPAALWGYGIGLAAALAVVAAIVLLGGYEKRALTPWVTPSESLWPILILLPAFSLQSAVEEILFRGWLLSAMSRYINIPVAVAVSSALFGLLHYDPDEHWARLLNFILFGLFACAWVLRTGNIWGAMGWHAGWNWLIGVGFELPLSGFRIDVPALVVELAPVGPGWLTGGATGPEGSIVCTAFLLVGIVGLLIGKPLRAAAEAA